MNEPAPRQRRNLGGAASFVAVALSLFALATSAYQARLMRDQTQLMQVQSRASVWPSLAIGENDVHSSTEDSFTWRVDNNGVGPAKIESVTVSLDGKPYRDWQSVAAVLAPDQPFHASQSSINGLVMPPGLNRETTVEMVKLSDPVLARAFHNAQSRFKIEICYCSVYDDCWIANINDRGKTPPVDRCETTGTTQFEQ